MSRAEDIKLAPPQGRPADLPALLFTMTFPSFMSWLEFRVMPSGTGEHMPALNVAFILGKVVQFGFPFVYLWFLDRSHIGIGRPDSFGMKLGILFGLVVGAGTVGLYFTWLKYTPVFENVGFRVKTWLATMNLDSPAGFLAMAIIIAVPHSFLEEYYWRGFVFSRLKLYLPLPWAVLLSAFAFMSHHVIVLSVYMEGYFWVAAVPFSLCVAGGGIVWAWLYHHGRSLYPSWISHLVVDLTLMGIGYDMVSKYW